MLHLGGRSTDTRHSYQSTGTRHALSGLAARLPHELLQSRSRHGRQLNGSAVNGVAKGSTIVTSIGDFATAQDPSCDTHEHEPQQTHGAGPDQPSTSFNQLALLYAIFLTLFGLIFPLSYYVSAAQPTKWFLLTFYILIYSAAIAFLTFFMVWIMSRPAQALFLQSTASPGGELVRLQDTERPTGKVEFTVGRFSVSESCPNFKDVDQVAENGFQNNGFDDEAATQAQAAGLPQIRLEEPELEEAISAMDSGPGSPQPQRAGVSFDMQTTVQSNDDTLGQKKRMKRVNSTLIKNAREFGVHEIQAYSVLSLQESHSPSFFLRVACFLFGGLKMAHDFLHLVDTVVNIQGGCVESTDSGKILQYCLSIVFTVLQTFFIFKYSKVSVNIYQRVSVLGFMHLMATNMCVWFEAILLETSHSTGSLTKTTSPNTSHHNSSSSSSSSSSSHSSSYSSSYSSSVHGACSKDVFWRMAPYLFPFTIEYSLMAAFSCYVLYCNVGKFLDVILTKGFNVGKKCLRNRKKSQTSFSASCYKSDKGFFLGALQMIVGVVSGIYFTIYVTEQRDDKVVSKYIFLITDVSLLTFNLLLSIIAYVRIRQLTLVHKMTTGPDSWLLGITLMGVLAFEMFQLFGAAGDTKNFIGLRVSKGIVCILQSTFQVFLVFDGEKRRSKTEEAIEQKPGREMIAALLLGNLALWVVYTLEVREINSLPNFNDAYVSIASEIFAYVCSPLIIFFRFHSACCFVDVWRHSYKGKAAKKDCEHTTEPRPSKDPDASSIHFDADGDPVVVPQAMSDV